MAGNNENIKKNQNASTRTHKNSQILSYSFLDENT